MGIDHSNPYIHSTTVLCDVTSNEVFSHLYLQTNYIPIYLYHICYTLLQPRAQLSCKRIIRALERGGVSFVHAHGRNCVHNIGGLLG